MSLTLCYPVAPTLGLPLDHLHQVLISHVLPVSYCPAVLVEDPDVTAEQHEAKDRVHWKAFPSLSQISLLILSFYVVSTLPLSLC